MVNEWTADDLPRIGAPDPAQDSVVEGVLDAVLHWLNKHHPKPVLRGDAALADHLGRQAVAIDELQLDLEAAEADRDRWRRAHEIVEGERDQARRERDMWEEKYLDTDEALHQARTERDDWMVRAENAEWGMESGRRWSNADLEAEVRRRTQCLRDNLNGVTKSRDEWQARAEAAEARTAPAVTKRELRSVVGAHDPGDDELAVSRVNALTDRLWSLVSGADPAVHVVRESDVAAVEVRLASDGWYADGAWLARADETAEWVRDRAAEMVVYAARNEAVARAIEQDAATDPLLDKAQEFAALADWELTDREAELLHTIAAHVLGQEAGDGR